MFISLLSKRFSDFPRNTLLPIPTPPVTLSAPVEKLVDLVSSVIATGSLNVDVPSTSKLVETLTLALISKLPPYVEIP